MSVFILKTRISPVDDNLQGFAPIKLVPDARLALSLAFFFAAAA